MPNPLNLSTLFPDGGAPEDGEALKRGRAAAGSVRVGDCAFLSDYNVRCELEYKQRARRDGQIMLHAQIGWRDPDLSAQGWRQIHDSVDRAGGTLDRYGICLDWSMGYPKARRHGMGKGTGLILERLEDFVALTKCAPVAPHFGDFVIGLPAALENTEAALRAGATAIGNLGQYFTFRMPGWAEDRDTTRATVSALALCAAQPVPILIHSNLDDGFAAQFTDLACAFGAVLIERHIVETLIGGTIGHCYGHTFTDLTSRLAFQRALGRDREAIPGTMVYGNTTSYRETASDAENYAALAAYLSLDMAAQRACPSGHAVTAIPVTEAQRIPDIDEVADAQCFAVSLSKRTQATQPNLDTVAADRMADVLIDGGQRFFETVLEGLARAGLDTENPEAMLLALRRIGAKRLEELFGPGAPRDDGPRGRTPLVEAPPVAEIATLAAQAIAALEREDRNLLSNSEVTVVVASTDVHEFGKLLAEKIFLELGLNVVDAGIHAAPSEIVTLLSERDTGAVALGTYNGIALDYARSLRAALSAAGLEVPVYIGGKLNQINDASNSSLPTDATKALRDLGVVPCGTMAAMLAGLADHIRGSQRSAKEETA